MSGGAWYDHPPWWDFARSVLFTVVGLGGIIYEATRSGSGVPERPIQMGAYLGLLGVNIVMSGRRKGGDDA